MSKGIGRIIKDCDKVFSGETEFESLGELQRWTATQIKHLAHSISASHAQMQQVGRRTDQTARLVSGGLGLKED